MARRPSQASTHTRHSTFLALLHLASGPSLSFWRAHRSLRLFHSNYVQPRKARLPGCEGQRTSLGLQSQRRRQQLVLQCLLLRECLPTDFFRLSLLARVFKGHVLAELFAGLVVLTANTDFAFPAEAFKRLALVYGMLIFLSLAGFTRKLVHSVYELGHMYLCNIYIFMSQILDEAKYMLSDALK
ncbi:hypothetical protein V8E53_007695 [Lactarius tabidus]